MTNEEMWRLAKGIGNIQQNKEEALWMVDRVPKYVGRPLRNWLEIGCYGGGGLMMWSQMLADDGVMIGITLDDNFINLQQKVESITGKRTIILNMRSELEETKEAVINALNGERLDGVFVDGEHTFKQIEKETELYTPLVRTPGVFAYHDIAGGIGTNAEYYQQKRFNISYEEKRIPGNGMKGVGIFLL